MASLLRCSFFTNLPWTLQDKDIDESVFNLNSHHTYLLAMIGLNRTHSEIIELANFSTPENKETDERVEYLDFRVQKLVESIPQNGFFPLDSTFVPLHSSQIALKRSSSFIYMRRQSHLVGDFHATLNTLSQTEFRLNRLNSKIWLIVTSSEGVSTRFKDIQLQFVKEEFFGMFKRTNHELLAVFGDANSRNSDSSNMSSYIDCMYDESALPPITWNYT
ncbi:hypothetical protein B0O99DRAFT_600371 [Bisporella sp. PMI_857]|nr:hypothetical protein B0O99DRAFT_600371 [Bisporella sp. PMI_857]